MNIVEIINKKRLGNCLRGKWLFKWRSQRLSNEQFINGYCLKRLNQS